MPDAPTEAEVRPAKRVSDAELQAMSCVVEIMEELPLATQKRVAVWFTSRWAEQQKE